MAESEEELKSLLMRVKEESEKADLELNIQKCKIMVSGPITSQLMLCCAKSLQSFPTLCDPIDCSPSGPLSLGFSRKESWSGLPSSKELPNSGIKLLILGFLHWQADSLPLAPPGKPS